MAYGPGKIGEIRHSVERNMTYPMHVVMKNTITAIVEL